MYDNQNMTRGGKRTGAGRPKGTSKYGEATRPVRIPESLVNEVVAFVESKGYQVPLFTSRVQAGLPTMADDHSDSSISLNSMLVKNPKDTFCVEVSGDSMLDAGIHENDMLVVDISIPAKDGQIVIAVVDGDLTVKTLEKKGGRVRLMPANKNFKPLEITEEMDFSIWGVVTNVIHPV